MLSYFSHVRLFVTSWTVACQAPLFMGFSRQEYWRELPFPSPGYLPNPGIEPTFSCGSCIAGRFFTAEPLGKPKKKSWSKFIRNCVCLRIRTGRCSLSPLISETKEGGFLRERKMFSEKWESEYCYFIVWISSPCAWVTRLIQTLIERIPVEGQPVSSAGDAEMGRVTAHKEFTV